MRIFLVGDYYSGTGPANVTKYYIEYLPKNTLHQKMRGKLARVPELIIKIISSDVIVFSGYSRQNVLGMNIARKLGKPTAYIMHGCVEYENEINLEPDEEMNKCERQMISLADKVFAVSASFAMWLKEYYPEFEDKFDYNTNGVDANVLECFDKVKGELRDEHMIFTIGGGMPRKKIKHICEAVELLRTEYDAQLKLTVIGDVGADTKEIDGYTFVDNKGLVAFDEAMKLMAQASVFVQNSCFETFGLAPVEAVMCGCSLLSSKYVGANSLFENISNDDIIYNYDDANEIAAKIKNLIANPNNARLKSGFDIDACSWQKRSDELVEKLEKLI